MWVILVVGPVIYSCPVEVMVIIIMFHHVRGGLVSHAET